MLIQQYPLLPGLYLNSNQDMRRYLQDTILQPISMVFMVFTKKLSLFWIAVTTYMDISPLYAVIHLKNVNQQDLEVFLDSKAA